MADADGSDEKRGSVSDRVAVSDGYVAFISYSHADQSIARRLQAFIERFRHVAVEGQKPRGLGRCFRDEDELAGGGLTPQIEQALANSRALIVICTPTASKSKWVTLEIETYRRLHPEGKIVALWFDKAERGGQALPGSLEELDLFVPEFANFGEAGLFNRAIAALLNEPVDKLVRRQEVLLRAEQRRARRTLLAGIMLSIAAIGGLGASFWLGWRNTMARSELIASSAALSWDGHNARLAGLLTIAASNGERGFMPEAPSIHPLLADVLASPTLPLGVYPLEEAASGAILRYEPDGRLMLARDGGSTQLGRDIHFDTLTPADRYVPLPRDYPCVLPAPEQSPVSSDQMEWAATPGCRFAFAIDGLGADFIQIGAAYNRASAGGGFRGEVSYVEVSPAGGLATTHGEAGITYVVSLNPSEIQVSRARTGISAVGFSADDQFLALGQDDGAVKLWIQEDLFSPRESDLVYGAPIAAGSVQAIVFAPGNGEFAVLYAEGVVARFRNEVVSANARRINSGRIRDFPYMHTPVLFSSDSRAAWIAEGNTGIVLRAGVVQNGVDDPNFVRDAEGASVGRIAVYEQTPEYVAFVGNELAAVRNGEIYLVDRGDGATLPAHLRDAWLAGACTEDSALLSDARGVHEVGLSDGTLRRSWPYQAGEVRAAACVRDGRVFVRTSDALISIDHNGRETTLRRIADNDDASAFAIATFNHGENFVVRGEPNVLLVGDARGAHIERIVVAPDASIVGYGVTPDGQFAIVGAQYGLESAPCVEWRVLHLASKRWLRSAVQGRPGDVYCPRMAFVGAGGDIVHWLEDSGRGYSTPLPSRAEAWRTFCTLARDWSFAAAEQAAYASLVSPRQAAPCASLRTRVAARPPSTNTPAPNAQRPPVAEPAPNLQAQPTPSPEAQSAPTPEPSRRAPVIYAPAAPQATTAPTASAMSSQTFFAWPATGRILLRAQDGDDTDGVFFENPKDAEVRAAADGEVVYADFFRNFRGLVLLRHEDGLVTAYGYLGGVVVAPGDQVRRGDVVGRSDERARLMFQVRRGADVVDPAPYFPER
ncbi:MAG TPA: peptidoglycan DD-metalloendopeptidase family protein [Hyphomonas sp.]|nr:peptidoglycan DD-metalloendopeptidase family protein [Hyphomonas sp.]